MATVLDGFSLEMTGKDVAKLENAAGMIPPGTRVHVTYLENEDLQARVNAAAAVRRLGFVPVPHISARRVRSKELLGAFLAALRGKHVSVAVHPDAHPDIAIEALWLALGHKATALTRLGIPGTVLTQIDFDADRVLSWVEQVRQRGIDLPVQAGPGRTGRVHPRPAGRPRPG